MTKREPVEDCCVLPPTRGQVLDYKCPICGQRWSMRKAIELYGRGYAYWMPEDEEEVLCP